MKSSKLQLLLLTFAILTGLLFQGCQAVADQPSADEEAAKKTSQSMQEANKQVGYPNITNWNEKELLKDLYELRDQENLQTYTYLLSWDAKKVFLGRSIGYGLPASVQFSNPHVLKDADKLLNVVTRQDNGRIQKLAQPEPNGLYMPEGLDATYVFLLDPEGRPRPVYIEQKIMVSPFKLH